MKKSKKSRSQESIESKKENRGQITENRKERIYRKSLESRKL